MVPALRNRFVKSCFIPLVSFGKENGTGLGLTVVQKIVQDHGGQVLQERTADARTVFRITLPGDGAPQGPMDSGDDEGSRLLPP